MGLISVSFKGVQWALAGVGLAALLVAGLVATPVVQPPELVSISKTARAVDRSDMPALQRFQARDGTFLAFRHYPARQPAKPQIAILVHGSSASGLAVHALAKGLAERGVESFAPDIRGHGGSGSRGDLGYLGQLEDDLTDLVANIRKGNPSAALTLIGHSSGGGFALRVAGSQVQNLFARTVMLAPYLGYNAPSSKKDAGGWASPDIPRFVGLSLLHRLGIVCCESLPTIAFAIDPNSTNILTRTYSYRLMRNFTTEHYREDIAAAGRPLSLLAGADDELMIADKYQEVAGPTVRVRLIPGVNHMGIVSDPAAVSAIADEVVGTGAGT